jgi:preprotein translocase subunit SecG
VPSVSPWLVFRTRFIMGPVFAIVLSLVAIFLILLVLVQRGRGGGLAGALGGMGGSSAFGAKAGDVFTRITIVTASIWILLCLFALEWAKHRGDVLGTSNAASSSTSGEADSGLLPAKKGDQSSSTAPAGESKTSPASGTAAPATPPATTSAPSGTSTPAGPAGDATNKEAPPGK